MKGKRQGGPTQAVPGTYSKWKSNTVHKHSKGNNAYLYYSCWIPEQHALPFTLLPHSFSVIVENVGVTAAKVVILNMEGEKRALVGWEDLLGFSYGPRT